MPTTTCVFTQKRVWTTQDPTQTGPDQLTIQHQTQDTSNKKFSLYGSLKTRVWQPRETLVQSETLRDIHMFISNHSIRRIKSIPNFPNAFTIGALTLQWLILFEKDLETFQIRKRLPKEHGFTHKISRYKGINQPFLF